MKKQLETDTNEMFAANLLVVGTIAKMRLTANGPKRNAEINARLVAANLEPLELGNPEEWAKNIQKAQAILARPHLAPYVEGRAQIRERMKEYFKLVNFK